MIVTTGTASGKTLAFNLPVLDALAREPKSRALYLYPTKALAQGPVPRAHRLRRPGPEARDLRRRHADRAAPPDPPLGERDPHQPRHAPRRRAARTTTAGATCSRTSATSSSTRRTSTAASSARTSRTSCAGCGGSRGSTAPSRSSCSPRPRSRTPASSARALLGLPVTVVGDDAAPRAERTVVLWNPPLVDEELGLRGSALAEAAKLQAELVQRGLRTLTFAKSRKAAELIHRFTAERLGDDSRLSPYRAGYTREQRREIERRLAEGELLGVSATNALELGIDVGLLDAVISVGFPGTVAVAPPAVGPRRAPRPRARGARRDRGRARPVLHARAREAARAPRRGGDPRPREPARARRARPRRRVRGADRRARTPRSSARRRSRPPPPTRSCAGRRAASSGAAASPRRRACRFARPTPEAFTIVDAGPARCSGSSSGRAPTRPCTRARSTSTSASPTSCASSTTRRCAPSSSRSPATGTRRSSRTRDTTIVRPLREERRCGLDLVFGEIEVTEQVVAYERKTIRSQERIELVPLDLPADDLRDRGGLVRAGAASSSKASSRCPCCSRRSTPPSTR